MLTVLLYLLFFASALLIILVVLVQEGKGGGLGGALGGAGAETFGVRAGGVNRVTFILFGVFCVSALALHWVSGDANDGSALEFPAGIEGSQDSGDGAGAGNPVVPVTQ
jgi:preprotein translocase subunit SecG